jgi:hypothetical protein
LYDLTVGFVLHLLLHRVWLTSFEALSECCFDLFTSLYNQVKALQVNEIDSSFNENRVHDLYKAFPEPANSLAAVQNPEKNVAFKGINYTENVKIRIQETKNKKTSLNS